MFDSISGTPVTFSGLSVEVHGRLVDVCGRLVEFYGRPGDVYGRRVEFRLRPGDFCGRPGEFRRPLVFTINGNFAVYYKKSNSKKEKIMSKKADYVPRRDGEFDLWFRNLYQYVSAKCAGSPPEWTHIPKIARDELKAAYDNWSKAYAAVQKPHTPAETTTKNLAKTATMKVIRPFVQQYIRFGPATEADCVNLKIPVKDRKPHPIARPARPPAFTVKPKGERVVSVDYREEGKTGKAKPYGYGGAVIHWAVLDKAPESAVELVNGKLSTKTPYTLEFKENERGKRVYVAVCWQNNKGEEGPVSGIQMAIVP